MDKSLQPFLDMSGYTPKTTFWQDFTIAETFGNDAILDTYERAFQECKDNVEYITEMVIMLNWKIWYHHELGNEVTAKVYNDLWEKADEWCMNNLTGDDLQYFIRTTD